MTEIIKLRNWKYRFIIYHDIDRTVSTSVILTKSKLNELKNNILDVLYDN